MPRLSILIVVALLCGCGPSPGGERHTVVLGGDVVLWRRVNEALFDDAARDRLLGGVAPVLREADLAVVNGEGVISAGGEYANKGEPRPFMYRAHPRMAKVLAEAGVDVVTFGNNHAGDYGREALVEAIDRLGVEGVAVVGAGEDLAHAMRPSYHLLGDTVVAVVGVDLTYFRAFEAGPKRPGTLVFPTVGKDGEHDRAVEVLGAIEDEARQHAHVVILTPHWGDARLADPAPGTRRLAARLVGEGYDAIVGHSSHWLQGVEVIGGRPVVYDAGNLLVDFGGRDDTHRDMLWQLEVSRLGVHEATGIPVWLDDNAATLAEGEERERILAMLDERSQRLGTTLDIRDGRAHLALRPEGMEGPRGTPAPPAPAPVTTVRAAPSNLLLDVVPDDALPLDVRYPDGIRLVGAKLATDQLSVPKAGQIVTSYWTADSPPTRDWRIQTVARRVAQDRERTVVSQPHIPGDWVLPAREWPVGRIVRDTTLLRLSDAREGVIAFYVGLMEGNRLVAPEGAGAGDEKLVLVGHATYAEDAPRLLDR